MSKSDVDSAIFMEDKAEDVKRKIKKAYCPEKEVKGNPILDYVKNIIFEKQDLFTIIRDPANGGDVTFKNNEEFQAAYVEGLVHPVDLKNAVADALNEIL